MNFSVTTIAIEKKFMHYYNEHLLYASLKVFINYQNSEQIIWHISYAPLLEL